MKLKSAQRRASETIDKRFCFDILTDRNGEPLLTLQATSDDDRRLWLDAMDGTEPVHDTAATSPLQQPQLQQAESECHLHFARRAQHRWTRTAASSSSPV